MKHKKSQYLLILGLIMSALFQIIQHYNPLSDGFYGGLMGVAFGTIIIALYSWGKDKRKILSK
ncbi:hypothetical protein DNU06_09075 [Putridiphycobacter roseus]|uniref:Uncharacterized protein n=1 Tax=Putridiphycobacter roseus TaxID=2219161 RepID=A0A2W1NP52_9FLAO|nr:hypothetical protein DNU06_09075 [Putridiphycobacter roseus]